MGLRFNRRALLALVAILATGLSLAFASGASAGPGIHVSGSYAISDFGATACQPVGSSGFIFNCATTGFVSDYSGDLTGTTITNFTQQINCNTSRTHGDGVETFTGSVAGVGSGTLTWLDHFTAGFDCTTFTESNLDITGVIISRTAALAGLHGQLSFTDTTYDGTLH
jgi:hypothetical protein